MKRNYILALLTLAMCPAALHAKDINPEVARALASKYVNIGAKPRVSTFKVKQQKESAPQTFYAFNDDGGHGFVLISSDDCINPVLGYSHSGRIDLDNMPPTLKELLNNVAQYIDTKRQRAGGTAPTRIDAADDSQPEVVVAPLVKTQWSQNEPYYNATPTTDGQKTYTGCGATAFAQILNYYKYPEHGFGKLDYATPDYDQKQCSIDLSSHTYDWDNMLPTYTNTEAGGKNWNDAQAAAVSTLMYDVGAAMHTSYSAEGSSTSTEDYASVAVTNFGYKAETYYKADYNMSEWLKLICGNLDNNNPVLLCGTSLKQRAAHAFVADGYDNNNNVHINWGRNGVADGYYSFHLLGPEDTDYNFNYDMSITVLEPNRSGDKVEQPQPVLCAAYQNLYDNDGNAKTYIKTTRPDKLNVNLSALIYYKSKWKQFNGKLRLALYNDQREQVGVFGDIKEDCHFGQNIPDWQSLYTTFNITGSDVENLDDGNYYYAIQSLADGSGDDAWTPVSDGYVYGLEKRGYMLALTRSPKAYELLTVTEPLAFDRSTFDLGDRANIKFTVQNNGYYDFDGGVKFYIVNANDVNDTRYLDKTCYLNIFDGDSYTVEMPLDITGYNNFTYGTYYVYLAQYANGRYALLKDVEPAKITVNYNADKYTVPYATSMTVSILGETQDVKPKEVITVGTSDEITFNMKYKWSVPVTVPEAFELSTAFHMSDCNTNKNQSIVWQNFTSYDNDEHEISATHSMKPEYVGSQSEVSLIYPSLTMLNSFYAAYGAPDSEYTARFYIKWIDGTTAIKSTSDTNVKVTNRWNADGMRISAPAKGLNIVRMSDGTVRKVFIK